jgi:prepilin-type N-terminal cleavage/methylation domain-containing protein
VSHAFRSGPGERAADGFTLLELMTVMALIGILAGVGMGFLSRSGNDLEVAWSLLREKVRTAHETARSSGRATEVAYVQIGERHGLRAKVLDVVGQWHLEPEERPFAGLRPVLTGHYDPAGRFGACMRPDPGKSEAMFALGTKGVDRFRLDGGFSFRIELYLEAREKCVVASLGRTFTLELDDDLRPYASMTLREPGDKPGRRVETEAEAPMLPLRRWIGLIVSHDGRELSILVEGDEVGRVAAAGEPYQDRDGARLLVSPESSPVPGKIDEIRVDAYQLDEFAELPAGVAVGGMQGTIRFDRQGFLVAPVRLILEFDGKEEQRLVAPGGVLQ